MDTIQFIIITIIFLFGTGCIAYNMCNQIDSQRITKFEVLLQSMAIIALILVWGLSALYSFMESLI